MQHEILSTLGSSLITGSLSDARVLQETGREPPIQILPKAHVLKIGGQSFIDRGRAAVFPLLEEVVENLGRHDMIIGTGGGSRARHAYSVGLDLGVPTGVLSVLGTFVSMQNARQHAKRPDDQLSAREVRDPVYRARAVWPAPPLPRRARRRHLLRHAALYLLA